MCPDCGGSLGHYQRFCTPCAAARKQRKKTTERAISHGVRSTDGTLAVECWCQGGIVLVPAATVRAGGTGSCGVVGCAPPAAA